MAFTAHNVRLSDGTCTLPDAAGLMAESGPCRSAIRTMRMVLGRRLDRFSVVDLGCLEGGYAAEFARLGMRTLGIDARQTNIDNCEIVRFGFGLHNLTFAKDDVNNVEIHGSFDVAFCSGILYHLDRPLAFLQALSRCTRKLIILHTAHALDTIGPVFTTLSDMDSNEGLPGRWYKEHDADNDADREKYTWSSWENNVSFWLTKPAIIHAIRTCGFDLVFEQMDWLDHDLIGSMYGGYYSQHQRAMIVGVKTAA